MAYATLAQLKAFLNMPHVRFVGSGLNDLTVAGIDANTPAGSYVVTVDGTGATDTFKWSNDNGATWEATTVNMATTAVTLENGLTVVWAAKTGHTSTNYWSFSIDNLRRDAILTTCLTDAQALIESPEGCDRVFEWSGDGTARYFDCMSPRPVCGYRLYFDKDAYSITTVTNGDGTTVAATTGYLTLPRNEAPYYGIELIQSSGLTWTYDDTPENALTVTAKWAYSASAPTRIVQATRLIAKYLFDLREGKALAGVDAAGAPATQYMPWEAKQILRQYKRRRLW